MDRKSTGDGRTASASITVSTGGDDDSTGVLWTVLAGVGVVALALSLAVHVVPARHVPVLAPATAETVRVAALAASGLLGLGGLLALHWGGTFDGSRYRTPDRDRDFHEVVGGETPVERPAATRRGSGAVGGSGVGEELDEQLDRVGGLVDEGERTDSYRAHKIRENLRELAVRVITSETNCTPADATARIDAGTWTDDPRAAALLADDTVVLPVTMRLRDWAHGESFSRQVEATVDELARYMGVDDE